MSDATAVAQSLGFLPPDPTAEPPSSEAQLTGSPSPPSAADAAAPSPDTQDPSIEVVSLDEALAELAGQTAPPTEAAPTTEPETDPLTAAPPASAVADLQRQLDEYKAREAIATAAQADAEFTGTWDDHWDTGYAWYDAERQRIRDIGAQQGRSKDEIDLAIYRMVVLGEGLVDRTNGKPAMGEQQWEEQTRAMERVQTAKHYSKQSAPSVFEQMASQYQLTDAQRTAVAKFINYPPEHLEEIIKTIAAVNQSAAQTQHDIHQQAVTNVRQHLNGGIAPGSPGAAPPQRQVHIDHTRQSTELVGRAIGVIR